MSKLRDVERFGTMMLAAALFVACSATPAHSDQMFETLDATKLANRWLRTDCYVGGEYKAVVHVMQKHKADLATIFEQALHAGPPDDYRDEAVAAADQLLTRFKAALASNETLGLDGAGRADADPAEFRARAVEELNDAYRERAALGMLVIEYEPALARLREIAADSQSPVQKYALDVLSNLKR